ncbi:MAG TPA: phosphoglucosamine mutase, partial [Candidatus Lokiarchaeia archaeon]|nr:phosphoglucosamine mutase [Candidatus Lokiarchaeia archaeon]
MTFWGTCGIRKIFHPHAEGFTPELALNLGLSLGTYVNGGVVVVGKDIRTAALPIEFALTSGLVSVGCHVLRIGLATTPTLAFATGELNAQAGVMITASHNTPDYIGVKFWQPSGLGFNTDQENEIEEIFNGRAYRTTHWNEIGTVVDVADFNSRHVTEIMKQVNVDPDGKHFSVVVDPGNGAACEIAPMLLKELYCRITTMNAQPDGYFPGRYSEPSRENLKMVSEFIRSAGGEIELGIALDGDGDRVIFIDEKGALVDPIRLMTLLTLSIAKGLPDDLRYGFSVAAPINSSSVLEDTIKPFG